MELGWPHGANEGGPISAESAFELPRTEEKSMLGNIPNINVENLIEVDYREVFNLSIGILQNINQQNSTRIHPKVNLRPLTP